MDRLQIAAGWTPARLDSLRAEMARSGLDGFIIPRWDAHQSEYVVIADERLAWATGFSGTWGLAIVTRDRAAVFVDGRYTVQAAAEVSTAHFEQQHLYDEPVERWLARTAAKGEVYGYDPLILNPTVHAQIEPTITEQGASLRAVCPNPIDQAWSDRPDTPIKPAFPFPIARAGESSLAKRLRLTERLRAARTDLLVETQTDNIAWLLNWRGDDVPDNPIVQAFMLVDATGGVDLFVDPRKLGDAVADFELEGVSLHAPSAFLERLGQRLKGGERVSMDPRFSPVGAATAAREAGATVLIEPDPLTALKAVKNPVELAGLRAASRRDSLAWVRFLAWLEAEVAVRPVSEMQTEEQILAYRQELEHFVSPSFRTIAGADANGAMCHYNAPAEGGALIRPDSLFLIDSGGQYLDGTTDTTRTVCFGPPPAIWKKHYTLVLKGHIRLASLRFPDGTRGYQIDAFAREALWAHGLDYDHGTGHGVGHFLSVHEHPQRIGKDPVMAPITAGMTLTNEPGYYEAGRYGIRIENLCEVVEDGAGFIRLRDMTLVPLDRRLIDLDLLTAEERAWVDAYHARVRAELRDLIANPSDVDWLIANTEPLVG
ncbi:M24 family metallopeptidase [Brevundimonas sp.]|uniref:M24 family metallopeptidase n=1 Tax=Brevundimonas sp. TaxID=1871086 RepID=UPI003D6D00DD